MARLRDVDACPGALTLHRAADGQLARIRLPGGMIAAPQLAALAHVARRFGSPAMELTSRGNIQIRGIRDETAVADEVARVGLLPSATHEKVRNIVASPLSGRHGGRGDVRPLVIELDSAIQAEPALATLSGRFWFGVDDGRGDVSGLAADVGVHLLDDHVALLLAGRDARVRVRCDDAVPAMIAVAARFAALRGNAWRVEEFGKLSALLDGFETTADAETWPPVTRAPVGWLAQDDGRVALGAAVPLGVLHADVAHAVAAIGAPIVITPWRSLLICDLDEQTADTSLRVLAPLGLVFDDESPWLDVSACTGSPGCQHSEGDVRGRATRELSASAGTHRHYVGCERACGSRPGDQILRVSE